MAAPVIVAVDMAFVTFVVVPFYGHPLGGNPLRGSSQRVLDLPGTPLYTSCAPVFALGYRVIIPHPSAVGDLILGTFGMAFTLPLIDIRCFVVL